MKPPIAKKIPFEIIQHKSNRTDNYAWLRDENWRDITAGKIDFSNPEILKYIEEENSYTDFIMEDSKELQDKLYKEILSHIKEDDESHPMKYGPYEYYSRTETGKEYPIFCRKKREAGAPEETYLDINIEAASHELYMSGGLTISPNHQYLAYTFNLTGSLSYSLKIRDTKTGKDFDWEIPEIEGSIVWAADNEHLYYCRRHPEVGRTYQVYQVNIQKGLDSKKLIFEKPIEHEDKFMDIAKTSSGQYIMIYLGDSKTSATYFWNSSDIDVKPILFTPVEEDLLYSVEHHEDQFFILSNADGATNFKIETTDITKTERSNWQSLIPHSDETFIEAIYLYQGQLIRTIQDNQKALPGFVIRNLNTHKETSIKMPQEAYDLHFAGSKDFITDEVRFFYESPTQPRQTIDLNLNNNEQTVRKTKSVLNYNAQEYDVKREFAEANDGSLIPITISYKKGIKLDGENPILITGYGSYGMSYPTYFLEKFIALLDRGFVLAIAHIRGGSDKGYGWYLDGKMMKKKNSFTDFVNCTEHLIERKYTNPNKVAVTGGSAGGLLMGAIANLRPDLFKIVVADVAFVDVVSTISDKTLPLTPPEWEEWGNPIEDKEAFNYISSYSPYDNIESKAYPTMLYTSGISDEQVTYWEPTKMIAKLRELKTDNNPLLLKMKMASGHAGASKRYEAIEEAAFKFAFIIKHL